MASCRRRRGEFRRRGEGRRGGLAGRWGRRGLLHHWPDPRRLLCRRIVKIGCLILIVEKFLPARRQRSGWRVERRRRDTALGRELERVVYLPLARGLWVHRLLTPQTSVSQCLLPFVFIFAPASSTVTTAVGAAEISAWSMPDSAKIFAHSGGRFLKVPVTTSNSTCTWCTNWYGRLM